MFQELRVWLVTRRVLSRYKIIYHSHNTISTKFSSLFRIESFQSSFRSFPQKAAESSSNTACVYVAILFTGSSTGECNNDEPFRLCRRDSRVGDEGENVKLSGLSGLLGSDMSDVGVRDIRSREA